MDDVTTLGRDRKPHGEIRSAMFRDSSETASELLPVLGHRAISSVAAASLSISLVRAYAEKAGDRQATEATREAQSRLNEAVALIRDVIVLGAPREVPPEGWSGADQAAS